LIQERWFRITARPTSNIYERDSRGWRIIAENLVNVRVKLHENTLYAYGSFTEIGGRKIAGLATWDGSQWSSVVSLKPWQNGTLNVKCMSDDGRGSLYFGGIFAVESPQITNLFRLRDGRVTGLGVSWWNLIENIEWWRGSLYVAGDFTRLDTVESRYFGAWHDPEAAVEAIVIAPTNVVSGNIAEIRVRISNLRPTNIASVHVSLTLPEGVSLAEQSLDASLEGTNLVWHLSDFPPGSSNVAAKLRFISSIDKDAVFRATISGDSIPAFRSRPTWTTISDGNKPPLVAVSVPAVYEPFWSDAIVIPASVPISADTSDPDGTINRVDFYAGTNLLGSAMQAPYQIQWVPEFVGTSGIRAIAVDDKGKTTISLPCSVTLVTRPPNDLISGRITLTNTVEIVRGTLDYATNEPADPVGSYSRTVWYEWRPGTKGLAKIVMEPSFFRVAVFRGLSTAGQPIATAPEANPNIFYFPVSSEDAFLIQVSSGAEVDFQMKIELLDLLANDNFSEAEILSGFEIHRSLELFSATLEVNEPPVGPFSWGGTVWFSWTAPIDGRALLRTDSLLRAALWEGTDFANLLPVQPASQNAFPPGPPEFPVRAGTPYYIQVDGYYIGPLDFSLIFLPQGGRIRSITAASEDNWLVDFAGYGFTQYLVEKSRNLIDWQPELTLTNSTPTTRFVLPRSREPGPWFWRTRFLQPQD
jgi:hypothetical protein